MISGLLVLAAAVDAARLSLAVERNAEEAGRSHVGACDGSKIRLGRYYDWSAKKLYEPSKKFNPDKSNVHCDRINGTCACGRASQLRAAARRTSTRSTGKASSRVCVIARTFVGHAETIQGTLQTLLASARAARRSVALEVHLLNTDKRPFDDHFRQKLSEEKARAAPDYEIHVRHYLDPGPFLPRLIRGHGDYGYVHTDLMLLKLRKRGGCDFTLITNGDNVFHINYLKQLLDDLNKHPDAVASAGEFWCYAQGRVVPVAWKLGGLDLSAALFRTSYLDARNETFILGELEKNRAPLKSRVRNADGHLAQRVVKDVGSKRARTIDKLLFFHF